MFASVFVFLYVSKSYHQVFVVCTIIYSYKCHRSCTDLESFARGGPTRHFFVCFFDEGKEDPNSTNCRQSSARQQNAI